MKKAYTYCVSLSMFFLLTMFSQSFSWLNSASAIITNLFKTESSITAASLQINKIASDATPLTGETVIYTIQYACSGLTDNCEGTVITDPLPPEVEYVGLTGSVHTTSEIYDAGSHTVTFTLVSPLNAGSSGQVQVMVRFPNGSTPNGTVASNTATISATNAPSVNSTANISAVATAKPDIEKYLLSGGAAGSNSTYTTEFCNHFTNENGTLDIKDIVIVDTLPVGSVLVQLNPEFGTTATYDPISHTVTFTKDSLVPGQCIYPKLTILYPNPPFLVGSTVENKAHFIFTPVGESRDTLVSTESHTLSVQTTIGTTYKNNSHSSLFPGQGGTYRIEGNLNGTEPLNDFCINDTIPAGLEVAQFDAGGWYYGGLTGPEDRVDIYYTTNLNGPTLVPGSPFSIWNPGTFITAAGDLGLTAGVEYITSLNWCFGDVPAGFATYTPIEIQYGVMNSAPPGIVTNCSEQSTSTSGATLNDDCTDLDILALDPEVKLNPIKSAYPGGTLNKGDVFDFQLAIRNELGGSDSIVNPIVYDLLPDGVTYEGNWNLPAWGNIPGYPLPTFSIISDYKGTGREFLRWEWTGASGIKIPPGERVVIAFDVKINDNALGGFPAFHNDFYVQTTAPYDCWGDRDDADIYDFDEDGNTTEILCGGRRNVNVNEIVSLESEKLVKGQLDTTWTKYPATGYTVPGGLADYQLIVRNKGNIQLDSVIVIDILPFVGDEGVINLNARDSRWRPNLVGQVIAPAGVTVYYSTEGNPCRSVEGIVPSGPPSCSPANWSTVLPSDITTVQSLKFDFGSTVLNPNDSLILEWPMRAPVNALATIGAQPDSTAWNSFGFIGQRVDNSEYSLPSEPVKVGISMNTAVPAVIGDFVWIDTNQNGIQNSGEPGYNGMRVELFRDNGDGISDPNVDTYVNFTVTANGGFYLFPYLPSGDYFLVFYKPAPFGVTTVDAGGDNAIDSDGVLANYNGFTVAITPVTNLSGTQYDLDWDLGIYPNGLAAIGNYVWADSNNDGIQNEPTSNGLNGVTVNLYDNSNPSVIYATTVTSNDVSGNSGYYLFDQLNPGNYFLEFVLPASTSFASIGGVGSSDPLDSDANTSTGRTEVFALAANVYDDTWDVGLILSGTEVCNNGIDDDLDGEIDEDCAQINGTVFEDINFGGGDGRNYSVADVSAQSSGWTAGIIGVENAIVELYDNAGDFIASTLTDVNGDYFFDAPGAGTYQVRVVNNTVTSNRGSNSTGQTIIPVQTFRTDGTTDFINEIGGISPALVDANQNSTNANLSTLSSATTDAQSVTQVLVGAGNIDDVDFGYNFDVVVNTNDAGQGSLRQFILNSNELDNTNLDQEDNPTNGVAFPKEVEWETSIFMIPGAGVHAIQPLTVLTSIRDPKTHISAYTQAGSAQGPIDSRTINVELYGNTVNFDGLTIYSSDVQISGLAVHSFRKGIYSNLNNSTNSFVWGNYVGTEADGTTVGTNSSLGIQYYNVDDSYIGTNGDNVNDANEGNLASNSYGGIELRNADNVLISGNYVGTDKTGSLDMGNTYIGVHIRDAVGTNYVGFDDNAINTTASDFRNVLSGNGTDGIRITNSDDQILAGNYIGTDVFGTSPLPNNGYGVQVVGTVSNMILGTDSDGDDDIKERNIISGNNAGFRFSSGGSGTNSRIAGNFVGVDVTGNVALPNINNGIGLNGLYTNTTVGTNGDGINDEVEGNVISGNGEDGIRIASSSNNTVAGNNIGVGYDNTTAIGNGKRGIFLSLTASNNTIGYDPSMTNTDELVVGNIIKNNNDAGIGFSGSGLQNRFSRNQLENNLQLGIDLDYDLVTANDNGDGDTGANNLLNFPVFESAEVVGSNLIISGFAPAGAEIEFFIADAGPNPAPFPAGYTSSFGEGAVYLFTAYEGSAADSDGTTGNYVDDGTGAITTKTQNRFLITIDTTGFNLSNGINITSTATDANNNTSEFSGWTSVEYIEVCNDGIDNDGDLLTDCEDPDCGPTAANETLVTCDNSNGTGSGTFFLPDASATVSGGNSSASVSYHLQLTEAQNGINQLPNSFIFSNATIYARMEIDSSGCYDTAEITLTVSGICTEDCSDGIDNDGDGLIDCFDCDECGTFAGCGDNDGDGVGDFCDLDDDNDGIPDSIECPGFTYGPELVINGDFEDAYAHWTSNFNRGWNNYLLTSDGCPQQGWVAISSCSSINGSCPQYYNYNGSTPDGSVVITDPYGTGANVIATTNCNNSSGVCLAEVLPDHTTGTGFSLYVDPSQIAGKAYWQQVVTVEANKQYEFSAWIMVIEEDPNLQFRINGATLTSGFNLDRLTGGSDGPDVWQQFFANWYSNSTSGNVLIELVNLTAGCNGNDIRLDDVSLREVLTDCDCDGDGVDNYLDLDSDNDGLLDVEEAGHGAFDGNHDGIIDLALLNSGTNGLYDSLETSADNGILIYTVANSEVVPDGSYDFCELDSDGDGCLDAEEEDILDPDGDGIAGTGIPSVDPTNGLIIPFTFNSPPNNIWQNPLIGPCLAEVCGDGLDNDTDGLTDCDDTDCQVIAVINNGGGCTQSSVSFSAADAGLGNTYNWNFGTNGTPTNATGLGPHFIDFSTCANQVIILSVSTGFCTFNDTLIYSTRDSIAPVFDSGLIPADVTISCADPIPSAPVVTATDDCSSPTVTFSEVDNQSTDPCGQNNYTIIRRWVTSDLCGNSIQESQTITIEDPTFACSGIGVIGGVAFNDLNNNGVIDDGLGGVQNLEVYLYEDNGGASIFVAQTITDANGNYSFSTGVTSGAAYRIEFVRPSGMIEEFTRHGDDNGTNVQFVNAPSCSVNVGLADPADYCEAQPYMYVSCYSFGASENNPIDAIVGLPLNPSSGPNQNGVIAGAVKHLANAEHVGSIFGMAYSKSKDMLYGASFMKRHVGFGPGGTGAIYQIDPNAPSPGATVLVDLNAIFGANTAGADPHPYGNTSNCPGCVTSPGVPDNFNCWNYDTLSWDAVGTISLGDIDVSDDGEELFVMNLADKMLYRIDIDNPGATTRYAFPEGDISCLSGGEVRPFAVEFENNKVFVGAVCDQTNSSVAMLYVYELDLSTSTWRRVLEGNYQRNDAAANGRFRSWRPFDTYADGNPTYLNAGHPILTSISFDNDAMVVAIRDMSGDQFGSETGRPDRACGIVSHISQGDIFRAGYNSTADQYELEFDATVNGITTSGLNSGYGIAGTTDYGSYYFEDIAPNGASQIPLGGLAQLPGGPLYISAYDVLGLYDFGIAAFDNQTGARAQSYQMATNTNNLTGFGKANGLGDLEFGCGEAPVEIGNRIWFDANANGIQDVTESGIAGVTVNLYNSSGDLVGSQITDASGEYYFSDLTLGDSTLRANDNYYVSIGGTEYDPLNQVLMDTLSLTYANLGQAPNNDINDSDGIIGTSSDPAWVLDYPFIFAQTTDPGTSDHNFDFGFRYCSPPEIVGVPNDTIVECQGIPDAPIIGTEIMGVSECSSVTLTLTTDTIGQNCTHGYTLIRIWTAEDAIGQITRDSQQIVIQDNTAPSIAGVPADVTVDCDDPLVPPVITIDDNCDPSTTNTYSEVIVYHPDKDWKSGPSCSILHTISSGIYDDKGTASLADDEMSFVLTIIGQNTGAGWSTSIGGNAVSGEYYNSYNIGPFLSNGPIVNFTISDDITGACNISITVDGGSF